MNHKRNGFTIVELAIVIVVIAALVALTAVSYGIIRDRARDTAITTEMTRVSQELTVYSLANQNKYPASLSQINAENTNSVTLTYTRDSNAKGYVLTGTKGGSTFSLRNTDSSPKKQ